MNLRLDIEILASLLLGVGLLELLAAVAAAAFGEPVIPYILSAIPALSLGVAGLVASRGPDRRMRQRDGFVVVVAAWFMVSLFGAVPYVLTGTLEPIDAFFEAASGVTTTGSTVMIDIDGAPHGVLFWRSLTQWVGGMGIIVLAVAVMPLLGIGGMQLFQAEVPGPEAGKLTPRIASTARRLYLVYVGITAIAFVALALAGMRPFDALCHALTAIATGGFSTRGASIAAWNSPAIEWILIGVMLTGGMNFVLHYRLLTGRASLLARDEELRFYFGLLAVFSLATWAVISGSGVEAAPVRAAVFQTVSLATTTGFASADYEAWPALAQLLMLVLLMTGGMAGSTSGGIKSMRLLLGFRVLRRLVRLLPHPHGMLSVHYGGAAVSDRIATGVLSFLVAYFALAGIGTVLVASSGHYDIDTSLSAALTALGNVGPGLSAVGPTDHFAHFPAHVKLGLVFLMIAGRLEIFTLLALFAPSFWRR